MAADDHAILVGISRYCDQTFGALNGPPNDVERMRSWLVSPTGGNLPTANVVVLASPASVPADTDPNDWQPGEAQFNRAFRQLVVDPQSGEPIRREGRLYLYFSGHGFSERRDQSTRAALFAANATRFFPSNICGTIYAQSAREQALFKEIVLIMDCCRDAELNLPFSQPAINSGTSDAATGVRFMALYGAPKGGKAQERSFPELNGMTCGLLTHALLKGLSEAQPDGTGTVSSTALKRYLLSTWATVCGDTPASEPEFVSPTSQDIQFAAAAIGVLQGFTLGTPPATLVAVDILDSAKNRVVRCEFSSAGSTVEWTGQPASALPLVGPRFELRLQPGLYRWVVTGDVQKLVCLKAMERKMSSSDRPVLIQAADGCSELYLVDDKFEVVASGVGHLYVQVSPGLYKVRQRIGDNERSQVVEVERSDGPRYGDSPMYVALPALSFASPIPLQGTNTSREFQQAALGQTGTTAAGEGTGRISLLVRDSRWEMGGDNNDRGEFLTGEVSRLSLGSLDGTFDRPLQQLGQVDIARGFFRASIDVAPGHYVLTQSTSEGLQHCLPLEVRAAWVPQVFLRIAQLGGNTQPQTLDLDHASIVYAGPGEQLYPSNPDLLLLEVVRKAFARRRTDIGADFLQELLEGKYRNPMLGLIGSHLLLDSAEQDKTRMKAVVDNTSALLGEDFPDIIALRLRLAARTDTPPAQGLPTVTSPPLLAASWAALTRQTGNDSSKRTAMDVARLFWFPCTVESTSTWFVWTEARNARRPTIPVPRSARGMPGDVRERGLTISLRNVEYETPTSAEHVQKLVEELLADGGLQDWVRSLKSDARNVGTSGSTLNQLDRGLLTAIASAQAGLVPGVIDAQSAASRLVQNLNVPLTTAGRSASTLLSQIPRPAARSDKHPNASNTNQSGLGGSLDEPD